MESSYEPMSAFSSIPKSNRDGSATSEKEALKSFSAYQNAHSFYKEIKTEQNALFNSQGRVNFPLIL